MGESKDKSGKKVERVVVRVQVDESEVVLGTLSEGKCDQMPLDLVFDREFKISHNSNSSSVFICGYRTEGPDDFYDSEGKFMFVAILNVGLVVASFSSSDINTVMSRISHNRKILELIVLSYIYIQKYLRTGIRIGTSAHMHPLHISNFLILVNDDQRRMRTKRRMRKRRAPMYLQQLL